MSIDILILVGIGGLLFAVFGYILNRDREKKVNATSEAEMKVTLAHISRGVDDIKLDVKTNKEQMNAFSRDLVRVDEIAKSAHKRIDKLEGKQNEN
ncbi:hypothetical protein [Solibacillus cecembensis]|uniref:hypothetical protein n=1 Tax=Solibacillus cecembensis TaxID=459347 RepID=UPI003D00908F